MFSSNISEINNDFSRRSRCIIILYTHYIPSDVEYLTVTWCFGLKDSVLVISSRQTFNQEANCQR